MTNAKYTSKGLPVVGEDVRDSYFKIRFVDGDPTKLSSALGQEKGSRILDTLERIAEENPEVFRSIEAGFKSIKNYLGRTGCDEKQIEEIEIRVGVVVCHLYGLLEAQAEANKLEEKLG